MKYIFLLLLNLLSVGSMMAQQSGNAVIQTKTDPQTGVRVTTRVTPLPTLSEQVADLEKKLAEAEQNPTLVQNGTVDKYKLALNTKRKELAEENAERDRIAKQQNK